MMLTNKPVKEAEFISIMAMMMSNVALSIDAVLPALLDIRLHYQLPNDRTMHHVITVIFVGLGIGELIFGFMSDTFGRKKIILTGVMIFLVASMIQYSASSYEVFLASRVVQGLGLSATRSIIIAVIRDKFQGDPMAKIMSFIATIFLLVPMLAPAIGQFILQISHWKAIIIVQMIFMFICASWFFLRIEESHAVGNRSKLNYEAIIQGLRAFLLSRKAVIFTLVAGSFEGVFIAYLGSSAHIFQEQYNRSNEFPLIFGGLAFSMALFTLFNGRFVVQFGIRSMVKSALVVVVMASLLFLFNYSILTKPPLHVILIYLATVLGSTGLIFGNVSAMATNDLDRFIGVGTSLFSCLSMVIGVSAAMIIGEFMSSSIHPLIVSFLVIGILSLVLNERAVSFSK